MSDNIYRKNTNTLELFNGRIADAYTKAQTDAKLGQVNAKFNDNADYLKGKNLFSSIKWNSLYRTADGTHIDLNQYACNTELIKVKPNTTYTVSANYGSGTRYAYSLYYDTNGNYLNTYDDTPTFTTPNNCEYVGIDFYKSSSFVTGDITNIQLEESDTATPYEPYRKSNVDITKVLSAIDEGITEYIEGEIYNQYDVVLYQGSLYYCKFLTSAIPTDTTYWYKVSLKNIIKSTLGTYASAETSGEDQVTSFGIVWHTPLNKYVLYAQTPRRTLYFNPV